MFILYIILTEGTIQEVAKFPAAAALAALAALLTAAAAVVILALRR